MYQDLYLHGLIGGSFITNTNTTWVRPTDWSPVPDLVDGTHKIYALVKLVPGTNHNYVQFSSDQDDFGFNVDWGDGNEEYATSGDGSWIASHFYDFDQISNDTLTEDGYKQALITITSAQGFDAGIYIGFSTYNIISEFKINSSTWSNKDIIPDAEHIVIGQNALTSCFNLFSYSTILKCVSISETLNTCTNFSGMFSYCTSLTTIPLLDTSSGTNFSYMFNGCISLTTIPLIDTSSGTNFSGIFSGCSSLTSIPLLDTSSGTNFNDMFGGCSSLTSIPLLDTGSGTDFSQMFGGCSSLTSIPLLDTSLGTDFYYMFGSCSSLASIPLLDTSSGTDFSQMFSYCYILTDFPSINTSSGTNFSYMFNGCSSLASIPLLDTGSGTDFSGIFSSCNVLKTLGMINIPDVSFSIEESFLDRSQVLNIFNALPIGTATITLSYQTLFFSNPELTAGDLLIATNKGWTVTS